MKPEDQSKSDREELKKEIKIYKANNGYVVRQFPEFMVFTSFDEMVAHIKKKLQ